MILIIKNKAVWKHLSGFDSYNAKAKLSFEDNKDAEYFIKNYNGQDDYKSAMQTDKDVKFSVYHQLPNGKEHKDDMIKRKGWKPLVFPWNSGSED